MHSLMRLVELVDGLYLVYNTNGRYILHFIEMTSMRRNGPRHMDFCDIENFDC